MAVSYPKTKGSIMLAYAKYIKSRWGDAGISECSTAVGLNLSELNSEKWYSLEEEEGILKWVSQAKGMEYCRKMGFATVAERGVISFVARLAGLRKVLSEGVKEYYDNFNHGEISFQLGEKSAVVELKDANHIPESCETWVGAFEGILKITGTKGAVKKTACQLKGDKACTYELKWQNPQK